jgi:site-specific DNA-cytosine methylase
MLWFNKSRRAQSDTDYETWVEGGVVPTLNAFDNGDVRATTVIVVRMREGKPGGGKGPLMSEDRSLTLATANDQTLFVFHPHRSDGVRLQEKTVNTLTAFMGTGGLNTPMVANIKSYDEYNDSVSDTHHTLRSGTKQSTGVVADSQVRRLTPLECERLQGFPDGWTEGQSDTHRYKQMGNAVAVPVVEWLIKGIVDTL